MQNNNPMTKTKVVRSVLWLLLVVFILVNTECAIQAYKFTHFSKEGIKTERIHLSFQNKLKLLFTGVDNPRPKDDLLPADPYKTVIINSNVPLESWLIPTAKPFKGTVLLFHGYTSNKSALLERAAPLLENGYSCLLTDFMGSGGSGGNQTTIGFKEAEEVKDCYNYIEKTDSTHSPIYLLGSSMGAVAIMKAIKDDDLHPRAIIIECPFGTMYETICARFRMLHIPSFPMAGILLFWGSAENGFPGFSHNPTTYAKYIRCPVLLQYGAKDDRVTRTEIDNIFANITAPKKLIVYTHAGHDNYLITAKSEWIINTVSFLNSNN
jgi:alpha-beta hydrolase superfamily lysophospholipase